MAQSPWKISFVAKLEQLSTVEVKHGIFGRRDIRPGNTSALPDHDGGIEGHSLQFSDVHLRPKVLAPHLERLQNTLDFDGQPSKGSSVLGRTSVGLPGVQLGTNERVPMPDRRDTNGHNLKNRITRVRGGP